MRMIKGHRCGFITRHCAYYLLLNVFTASKGSTCVTVYFIHLFITVFVSFYTILVLGIELYKPFNIISKVQVIRCGKRILLIASVHNKTEVVRSKYSICFIFWSHNFVLFEPYARFIFLFKFG